MMTDADAPAITRDAFYGGRLTLAQPARGHRSGTDAVLLAAAAPRSFSGLACDVGSGVGVAGLGIALACPTARVRLVEREPLAAALAEDNILANGLSERCHVARGDLFQRDQMRALGEEAADLVVTNPPFWAAGDVRASPDAARSAAHVLDPGKTLHDWLVGCLALTAAHGTLVVLHAPMAVPAILATLERRLGGLTLLCIHARADAPATRMLVRGTRGSRAPLSVAPPLVLHEADGRFTAEADRLHRGDAGLTW